MPSNPVNLNQIKDGKTHLSHSSIQVTYDRLAARYDAAIAPLERWFLTRLRARTLAHLPEASRILEVGAGTALNFPFYPNAAHSIATEPSREMLKRAQSKNIPQGVSLVQSCAERLPFPDHTFDAAFATLVFCSVAAPEQAFKELRRVVRPGGTIALLEHVRPTGVLGYVFDALNILTVALFEDHFNRRTVDEALRAGLTPVSVERRAFGIIQIIVCKA